MRECLVLLLVVAFTAAGHGGDLPEQTPAEIMQEIVGQQPVEIMKEIIMPIMEEMKPIVQEMEMKPENEEIKPEVQESMGSEKIEEPVEEMKPAEIMEGMEPANEIKIDKPMEEIQPVVMVQEVDPDKIRKPVLEDYMVIEDLKPIMVVNPAEEIIPEVDSEKIDDSDEDVLKPLKDIEPFIESMSEDKIQELIELLEPMGLLEMLKDEESSEEMKPDTEKTEQPIEEMLTTEAIQPIDEEKMVEMNPTVLIPSETTYEESEKIDEGTTEAFVEVITPTKVTPDEVKTQPESIMMNEESEKTDEVSTEAIIEEITPTEVTPDEVKTQPESIMMNEESEKTDEVTTEAIVEEITSTEVTPETVKTTQPEPIMMPDAEKETYEGAQMLRVKATTNEQRQLLDQLQEIDLIDTWLRPAKGKGLVDIMVSGPALDSVKSSLQNVSAPYQVIIQDVKSAITAENLPMSEEELNELEGRMARKMYYHWRRRSTYVDDFDKIEQICCRVPSGHRMTWQSYHRLSDIHGYLDYLAQTYPDICSVTSIGNSVEGRPLKVLRISSRNGRQASGIKPAFWIDGGIHAREWISPAAVTYIIQELVENRESHSQIANGIDFYILPVVNPDGYEYTHDRERLWRKNRKDPHLGRCSGTDLNRNWGYKWGGQGSSRDRCKEIYAGANAFSEPETQAIRNFVSGQAASMRAYVTFHSYGQYILYPWGYDRKVPPDYADLDRVGKLAAANMRRSGGASYTVGNSASTLYPASGGADDWAKGGPRIKYTYTIELRDRGQYGFLLPATFITPTGREAFAAVKTVAEAILNP